MGNEWQTVQGSKNKSKGRLNKGQDKKSNEEDKTTPGGLRTSDPAGIVLAQVDADWNHARSLGSKQSATTANGLGSFETLEVRLELAKAITFATRTLTLLSFQAKHPHFKP